MYIKQIKRLRTYSRMLTIVVICGWWNKVIVIFLFGFPVLEENFLI